MTKLGLCDHIYEGNHTYTGYCPVCEEKMFGILPQLVGSEKQVNWAMDIRQKQLREVAEAALKRAKSVDAIPSQGIAALQKLAGIAEAKFWIENRTADANSLLKAALGVK